MRKALAVMMLWMFAATAAAQDHVDLQGRVEWVAGETMVVAPPDAPAVSVDLSQVPLDQYADLRPGDSVRVDGIVSDRRNRVIASEIHRLSP